MGTIIKASSVYSNGVTSSIDLAVKAGEDCIGKSGIEAGDIDLLIYSGVYRDDNLMEPAIAPIIQKRLGLNNDPTETGGMKRRTFSFDINNGVCGFLTAARVADASLKSGASKNALIISSDVHPSKKHNPDFPFTCMGSAALLTTSAKEDRGFRNFIFKTSGNGYAGFTGYAEVSKFEGKGRGMLTFSMEKDFHDRLHEFAVKTVKDFIMAYHIDLSGIDLLLTSQQYKGLGMRISSSIGLNAKSRAIDLHDTHGDPHTSSLTLGFDYASEAGFIGEKSRILFIAAGAGLSSACALYEA
jgi:3-oxoacyl-[acyl-carrier-protein] synthase-3